jgi:hypothetical protein
VIGVRRFIGIIVYIVVKNRMHYIVVKNVCLKIEHNLDEPENHRFSCNKDRRDIAIREAQMDVRRSI